MKDFIVLNSALKDLIINFIDVMATRGAIKGEELESVAFIRRNVNTADSLEDFLKTDNEEVKDEKIEFITENK